MMIWINNFRSGLPHLCAEQYLNHMATFNSKQLLDTLQHDLANIIAEAQALHVHMHLFNKVPSSSKWTIAQVLEHLNTYHDHYLPELERRMTKYGNKSISKTFTTGILGGYLTQMMQPDNNGKVSKKTKALKKHIPPVELNANDVWQRFMTGQEHFIQLLRKADQYDLNQVRISTSISSLIRLKLGDILRVLVVHQQRHFIQIEEALAVVQGEQRFNA